MKQHGHIDLLTDEEKRSLKSDIKALTNDAEARSSVTYHYKESEAIDYDTGLVGTIGGGSETIFALVDAISREEALDINVPVSSQVLLVAKEDLDDVSITPELWEHVTINSIDYEILSHELPLPGLHYRLIINQRGSE
jgi:hypothetical protein